MRTLRLTIYTNSTLEYTVKRATIVIGSDRSDDITILDVSVDRGHAKIFWGQKQYYLQDCGSTTGTYLKGIRLEPDEVKPIFDGNMVQFGDVLGYLEISPFLDRESISSPALPMRLDAIDLHKSSRPLFGKTLLNNISLSFREGEFVIIAGVSGSGKSTLLNALSGQRRPSGKVLVNGCDLYKNFSAFKNQIGYVPQEDIVHPELTVWEAFKYAAQLRLPSVAKLYRQQRIQEVLEQLQLRECKNRPIGRLSGGQRKRVSLGVELIANPSLLFLDEATSGLDPNSEWQIMELLRRIANAGSTVVLISHATKNVAIADNVVFLSRGGRLAYYGLSQLVLRYFQVQDFDDIYYRVEQERSPKDWEQCFIESGGYKIFISDRLSNIPKNKVITAPVKKRFKQQLIVLCRRNLTILVKDKMSLALTILGAPILGSLNFVLWRADLFNPKTGDAGQVITMFYVTVIMAVMTGGLATMLEIVKERAIYRREHRVGLGIAPYIASKLVVALVLAIYQSAVLLALMLMAVRFPGEDIFVKMHLTLFLASFGSMVLGLIVSAIVPKPSMAPLLTIIFLVPQIMFGGGILPPGELSEGARTINQYMITKYPFESLVSLSRVGSDVSDDACWQKPEHLKNTIPKVELAKCNCYGKNVFTKCKFPGIGQIKRSMSLNADLLKAHLLIQKINDSYGKIFDVDVTKSNVLMSELIVALIVILFLVQKTNSFLELL